MVKMDKKFYKKCLHEEVFSDYKKPPERMNFIEKYYLKHIRPSSNAVYLIRKMQYYFNKGGVYKFFSDIYALILARRYSIYINEACTIGIGFKINHPSGICICRCEIGENFYIFQNCTLGVKAWGKNEERPIVGSNVTMFANSLVIGNISICDCTEIAANACLLSSTYVPGLYGGTPAKLINAYENGYYHQHH